MLGCPIIHLGLRDSLGMKNKTTSHNSIHDLTEAVRKMAGHFNSSVNGNKMLRKKQAY